MHLHRARAAVFLFTALSGGAAIPARGQVGESTRPNDRAEAIAATGTPMRWQAHLKATMQRSGMVVTTVQNKTTGSVFISQAGQDRIRIRLTVSTSFHDNSPLSWAIIPGRCGSNMMPIAPVERFPVIDVSSNGRGEVDRVLPLTMPASGQFHVNVYRGGTSLENVLTCGNLSRSK